VEEAYQLHLQRLHWLRVAIQKEAKTASKYDVDDVGEDS